VNIRADVGRVEACLEELGICFCFAPLLHSAMKHVAAIRKKLGVPTIFNILGPLANPAGAQVQLVGVGRPELQPVVAGALGLLGSRRAVVVHGADGLDEVTLADRTYVVETRQGVSRKFEWMPGDFGLDETDLNSMRVDGPPASAAIIRRILAGESGPPRDIVVANAAAALWAAGRAATVLQAARKAEETIDSGAAAELLARLAERSNQ